MEVSDLKIIKNNRKWTLGFFGGVLTTIVITCVASYLQLNDYYFTVDDRIMQYTLKEIVAICLEKSLYIIVFAILVYAMIIIRQKREKV